MPESQDPTQSTDSGGKELSSTENPVKTSSNKTSTSTDLGSTRLVEECQRMLRFALDKGKAVPDSLAAKISQIDACLRDVYLETIAEVPSQVFQRKDPVNAPSPPAPGLDFTAAILSVHSGLSVLVAPATAQTLWATSNDHNIKLFFNLPFVVKTAMLLAVYFAVMFVLSVVKSSQQNPDAPSSSTRPSEISTIPK